jgi:hypothetical protein
LIVERAFESWAADAVAKAAGFAPDFFQHAIECFHSEGAAIRAKRPTQAGRRVKIG